MIEKLNQFLLKSLDNSSQSVFIMEKNKEIPFYANKQAMRNYSDGENIVEINRIFTNKEAIPFLTESAQEQLSLQDYATICEISTTLNTGEISICDVQIKYCNDEKTVLFLEMFPKTDTRMEQAISQVTQSTRADAILHFDETLTLVHGNTAFFQVFEMDEKIRHAHFGNEFAKGFPEHARAHLLQEIHDNLNQYPTYFTKSKLVSSTGEEKWYSLEFQRRTLDNSGRDKLLVYMMNIDKQMEIEQAFDTVSQYFNTLQELSDDMLYRVDLETKTLYRTSEQAQLFGISAVMPNYPYSIIKTGIIHPEDEESYGRYGCALLEGRCDQVEIRMKSGDGEYEYRRLTCAPVGGKDGTPKEMFGKIVDIQKVRELEEQANFDGLTRLLNKRAMLEATSHSIQTSSANHKHALIFMDLDDFKYVNDNLGHAFGDYLLSEIGTRIRDEVREKDHIGRVGGDEFVIFLRDVPSVDLVLGKGKMLLSAISQDIVDGDKRHCIHGSVGVAIYPDHGTSYEELYHHADLALYRSKHKGKNQVTLYSQEMTEE